MLACIGLKYMAEYVWVRQYHAMLCGRLEHPWLWYLGRRIVLKLFRMWIPGRPVYVTPGPTASWQQDCFVGNYDGAEWARYCLESPCPTLECLSSNTLWSLLISLSCEYIHRSLLHMWGTSSEFLDPGFYLSHPWLLWAFKGVKWQVEICLCLWIFLPAFWITKIYIFSFRK